MGNRALRDASQGEWASDAELGAEALIDETAEREWQELLAWARESGALYEPEEVEVTGLVTAPRPANQDPAEAEDEEWQWQLARAKASGDGA